MDRRSLVVGGVVGVVIGGLMVIGGVLALTFLDGLDATPTRDEVALSAVRAHAESHEAPRGTAINATVRSFGERAACVEVGFFLDGLPNDRATYFVTWRSSGGPVVTSAASGWYDDEAKPELDRAGFGC